MKVGDITEPLSYTDERGRTAVRIVYFVSQTQPHRENLKDDYDKVSQRALAEKKQTALDTWFKQHISDFYVDIDDQYRKCGNLSEWWTANANTANK